MKDHVTLHLDFDAPLPDDAVLAGDARLVDGRTGQGIVAHPDNTRALTLPPEPHLNMKQGTLMFWWKPREKFSHATGLDFKEYNLVGLDNIYSETEGFNKVFNAFLRSPKGPRLRAETFHGPTVQTYHGTDFEYIRFHPDKWYHFAWTWDGNTGVVRQYLNAREDANQFRDPWEPQPPRGNLIIGHPHIIMDDVTIYDVPLSQDQIAQVAGIKPAEGLTDEGLTAYNEKVDWPRDDWELVYSNNFDDDSAIEGWVGEGPIYRDIRDGKLLQASSEFHAVHWCPFKTEPNFYIEYDFGPADPESLYILFFAANGLDGRDLFDPSLAERTGNFADYIRGDIRAYHVSYLRRATGICNLRKDPGMALLAVGYDKIPSDPDRVYKIQLLKVGPVIEFAIDGDLVFRAEDEQVDNQPVWRGGYFGFRNMTGGEAYYDNLRVYQIP